jgi:esterase/lipase superfamily enzyme
MTKWLIAFLLAMFGIVDTASAQDRWARIDTVTARVGAQQVLVDASGWGQRCKGIRIAVTDATIAIERISIVYASGRVHAEDVSPPVRVAPGTQSRVFAATNEAQQIRLITIRFSRLDRSARPATIEVWGLQPPAPTVAPPVAKRPEFRMEAPPAPGGGATPPAQPRIPSPPREAVEAPRPAVRAAPPAAQPRMQTQSREQVDASRSGDAPRTRSLPMPAPSARAPETVPPPVASAPPASPPPPAAAAEPAPAKAKSRSLAAAGEPQKPYNEVDVFFGTDRKREADRSKFGRAVAAFGTARSNSLTLGKAVVTVPKEGREKGSIPRPEWDLLIARFSLRDEDLSRDFTVFAVDVMDRNTFVREARAKLATSSRFPGQAFVFVHGYFVTFDDALFRAAQIAHDLEFDGVPFVYSWPSVAGLTGYVLDRGRARDARDHLRDFVDIIAKESGAAEVHLIAHSMGADPLLEVLRDIQRSEPQVAGGARPRFGEIILAAPDVTRESFELIAAQITGLRRGMTLYASSNDRALAASRWTRLGESPAGYVPSSGPVVVPGAADTIDISSLDTSFFRVNHSTFADREALLGDIRRLISSGLRPPSTRGTEFELVQSEGGAYWRYRK